MPTVPQKRVKGDFWSFIFAFVDSDSLLPLANFEDYLIGLNLYAAGSTVSPPVPIDLGATEGCGVLTRDDGRALLYVGVSKAVTATIAANQTLVPLSHYPTRLCIAAAKVAGRSSTVKIVEISVVDLAEAASQDISSEPIQVLVDKIGLETPDTPVVISGTSTTKLRLALEARHPGANEYILANIGALAAPVSAQQAFITFTTGDTAPFGGLAEGIILGYLAAPDGANMGSGLIANELTAIRAAAAALSL